MDKACLNIHRPCPPRSQNGGYLHRFTWSQRYAGNSFQPCGVPVLATSHNRAAAPAHAHNLRKCLLHLLVELHLLLVLALAASGLVLLLLAGIPTVLLLLVAILRTATHGVGRLVVRLPMLGLIVLALLGRIVWRHALWLFAGQIDVHAAFVVLDVVL